MIDLKCHPHRRLAPKFRQQLHCVDHRAERRSCACRSGHFNRRVLLRSLFRQRSRRATLRRAVSNVAFGAVGRRRADIQKATRRVYLAAIERLHGDEVAGV